MLKRCAANSEHTSLVPMGSGDLVSESSHARKDILVTVILQLARHERREDSLRERNEPVETPNKPFEMLLQQPRGLFWSLTLVRPEPGRLL